MIIRTYYKAYLWQRGSRSTERSILEILRDQNFCEVNVGNQRQGESIALNPEGTFYLTHSESVNETIWRYNIIQEDGVSINVS